MSRIRYPEEFKIEVVKQVIIHGDTVTAVVGRLGMSAHSLYTWIKRYGSELEALKLDAAE